MTIRLFARRQAEAERKAMTFSFRLALTYSAFLLVCLVMGVVLYVSSTQNARDHFWAQRAVELERAAAAMDEDLSAMDSYTRQLLIDSTFIRFCNMNGIQEQGFVYTAYEVMQTLSSRLYSISNLPFTESRIYLNRSGYVISASQFTEVREFYEDWRIYHPGGFEEWLDIVLSAVGTGGVMDISSFTGRPHSYVFIRDIDAIMNRSVPAVIWFELDMKALRERFLPQNSRDRAIVIATDAAGEHMILADGADEALAGQMNEAVFDEKGYARLKDMRLIRCGSEQGWTYTIALPESLCSETLGNYDFAFWLIMLIALVFGAVVIALLVRAHMRPIRQLNTQLKESEGGRAMLQQEMDSQRPMLETSYLRKLLSGHVTSSDEFDYMMHFLGLQNGQQFYVLYCVAHRQDDAAGNPVKEEQVLEEQLRIHLSTECPLHFYATAEHSYVVLAAYHAEYPDPLMDLQRRVLALHDELAQRHSLWLYAGVGTCCTQAQNLWESYEQARRAARYTAKHHIFLPYEVIQKETDSFFYPVEISSKLQNFITTGNRQQVVEMFALLRRENLEERSLPLPLLNFLLSDLKNTLLKARFQATAKTPEENQKLAVIDERLYGQATFPVLENTALMLCECFTRAVNPADPIADIEQYLSENFTDPSMCLSKLSDQFHISESYLSHLFKNKTGQNLSVYLETLRLNEAASRLMDPDCNLSNLFAELGYNNVTTFRRAFKKRYGITPSEMRAQK